MSFLVGVVPGDGRAGRDPVPGRNLKPAICTSEVLPSAGDFAGDAALPPADLPSPPHAAATNANAAVL